MDRATHRYIAERYIMHTSKHIQAFKHTSIPEVLRTGQAHTSRAIVDPAVQIPLVTVSVKKKW